MLEKKRNFHVLIQAAAPIIVPKSPRRANDARQPRQSSGTAIPAIKPRILPAPAPNPAPTPPDIGARGMNVGPRLIKRKFNYKIVVFFFVI